jgi:hypothetical protein
VDFFLLGVFRTSRMITKSILWVPTKPQPVFQFDNSSLAGVEPPPATPLTRGSMARIMSNPKKTRTNAVRETVREVNAALDKLRRKRSELVKDVGEANAALEAHLKMWGGSSIPVPVGFNDESATIALAAAMSVGDILEYDLAIAVNDLFHFDDEVAGELNSVAVIERFETRCARETAPKKMTA